MDANRALDLIRRETIFGLCSTDGCLCVNFEVHGIHVDISCRKCSDAMAKIAPNFYGIKLRVYSSHLDSCGAGLRSIADEVAAQLKPEGYAVMVRFCEDRADRQMLCTYCGKPRENKSGYLCQQCLIKPGVFGGFVADDYDFQRYDFVQPESSDAA